MRQGFFSIKVANIYRAALVVVRPAGSSVSARKQLPVEISFCQISFPIFFFFGADMRAFSATRRNIKKPTIQVCSKYLQAFLNFFIRFFSNEMLSLRSPSFEGEIQKLRTRKSSTGFFVCYLYQSVELFLTFNILNFAMNFNK